MLKHAPKKIVSEESLMLVEKIYQKEKKLAKLVTHIWIKKAHCQAAMPAACKAKRAAARALPNNRPKALTVVWE